MVKITEKQDTIILSLQHLCLILVLCFGAKMIVSMNAGKVEDVVLYAVPFLAFFFWGFLIAKFRYYVIWDERPPDGPLVKKMKTWLKSQSIKTAKKRGAKR